MDLRFLELEASLDAHVEAEDHLGQAGFWKRFTDRGALRGGDRPFLVDVGGVEQSRKVLLVSLSRRRHGVWL